MHFSSSGAHPFPHVLRAATSLQHGDSFLVIGAHNATSNRDTVYRFNPATEGWTLVPGRMARIKHAPAAFLVGPEDFPACE